MTTELQQTKGTFKLIGKVTNIDRENNYVEKIAERGKRKGDPQRQLRFGVRTSTTNEIQVGMFSYEPEEVFLWNSTKRKDNPSYKGERVEYSKWSKNRKNYEQSGTVPLQTKIGIEYATDEKGKLKVQTQNLPTYDAMEYIHEHLYNGDSIVVEGDISYNTYENKQGQMVTSTNYNVTSLFKLKKEVDFESEDFEETSLFVQEMVFVDAENFKKESKAEITGRIIAYNKQYVDADFTINYEHDDEANTFKKMAEAYAKAVKFGSLIKVHGNIVNRAVTNMVEADDGDKNDILAMLSGEKNRMEAVTTYQRFMEIRGTDDLEAGVYDEDDFTSENDKLVEEVTEDEDDALGDLRGNGKSKVSDDPFGADSDDFEIDDDSLPF